MASSESQTQTKDGNLAPASEDAADLSGSDVEGGKHKSISIEDCPTDLDTSGVTSPISAIPSKFNVDSDVLARSPMGSVVDLTAVQSEIEGVAPSSGPASLDPAMDAHSEVTETALEKSEREEDVQDASVAITVTSPGGTARTDSPTTAAADEEKDEEKDEIPTVPLAKESGDAEGSEFTNSQGVTFTPTADVLDETGSLIPYGLPCVRELFRFLVSLVNPHDGHNQDSMIQIALHLIATALETGADHLDKFESLLLLVKDDLARNLVSLLSAERIGTFSSALWVSYMMFESQRDHLKFQLEIFLNKLIEVVCTESQRVTYEHKELALEMVLRLYRIPGFLTQLYLNFDCGMYTSNIFEDLTKMLSKNAFPVTGLYSTHFLSLDALLSVIESIEAQCQRRIGGGVGSSAEGPTVESTIAGKEGHAASSAGPPFNRCSGYQFATTSTTGQPLETAPKDTTSSDTLIPSHEEVMALKHKKKLITTATEQFNAKPSKGIAYMQECGLIKSPVDNSEVAAFMRQNPHLDKKQIGEYISNRKNLAVLEAFVRSFDFVGLRVDESLRQFLEAFRLPGEAPLITLILEHFADHWQKSNGDPFADADAAFTLSYAVIMLNVDQHNKNATKNNDPMTPEQFMRNVRGTNGGGDHDQDMLSELYHAIRSEEIVMPAEQTGLVRENYLWKCVLKRGVDDRESRFMMAPNGYFDHDLFAIIWGSTVAALSYVFDKSEDAAVVERALNGFQRCAMIAAHYHMSDVFDNLVISLCKFSTLLTVAEPESQFIPVYGMNTKAMLATRTVFSLVQRHGDILRDGWRNVTECLLQLFKCQLLPQSMMEADDFLLTQGRVQLYREDPQSAASKQDTSFLNSFMSFVSMGSDQQKVRTPEEEESAKMAQKCINDCNLEAIITESKFLHAESLQELIKFLVAGSKQQNEDQQEDEHAVLFFQEMIVRITGQNLDRVPVVWKEVSEHISTLIAKSTSKDKHFLLERSVTALLRLAVRLSRKSELASIVVQSLRSLLAMKVNHLFGVCRQIAFGLHELLRNNAANIHDEDDWTIIFALIEVIGAGANTVIAGPENNVPAKRGGEEDSGHGASSESEAVHSRNASPVRERSDSFSSGGWIVLGSSAPNSAEDASAGADTQIREGGLICFNRNAIVHPRPIVMHDAMSFFKCCESLEFLIRDVAHITPHNFPACVRAVRTFVEASFVGRPDANAAANQRGNLQSQLGVGAASSRKSAGGARSHAKRTPQGRAPPMRRVQSAPHNVDSYDADESDSESNADLSSEYHHATLQIIKLIHTLHTGAGKIYSSWAEAAAGGESEGAAAAAAAAAAESDLWTISWCPLMQGMARLCCDKRSHIRTYSLTKLQSSLLYKDLVALGPTEWESAFTRILFPMLSHLLTKSNPGEKTAMEETRMRAATLLCKVFLQHLSPLTELDSFRPLWLTIIDFMENFIGAASSDLLADAVPESLKNMLLVMDTAGIFFSESGSATELYNLTSLKLQFLPNLMADVFGEKIKHQQQQRREEQDNTQLAAQPQVEHSTSEEQPSPEQDIPKKISATLQTQPPSTSVIVPESANPQSPMDPPIMPASVFFASTTSTTTAAAAAAEAPAEKPPLTSKPPVAVPPAHSAAPAFAFGPPPPLPSSTIMASTAVKTAVGGSPASVVVLPAMPEIAPMPPPPPGIQQLVSSPAAAPVSVSGFQPIHVAHPTATAFNVPVANPKPQMPPPPQTTTMTMATAPYLAQPIQQAASAASSAGVQQGNILTAAFTPTMVPSASIPVVIQESAPPSDQK